MEMKALVKVNMDLHLGRNLEVKVKSILIDCSCYYLTCITIIMIPSISDIIPIPVSSL